MRLRALALLPILTSAILAAPAHGAVECGVVERAIEIRTTAFADGVAIVREGDEIAVSDDRLGQRIACAGAASTVSSVDSIALRTEHDETSLYVDLAGGPLPPIEISWLNGSLGIGGSRGDDAFAFGSRSGSLVSLPESDLQVAATGTGNMLIRGGRGGDRLDLAAGIVPARVFATILAGPGKDKISGGLRPDEIDCGGGRDRAVVDSDDHVRQDCERVKLVG